MSTVMLRLAAEGTSVRQLAEAAALTWHDIDDVLSPIIGQNGVAALFQRALHATQIDYPWLIAAHQENLPYGDYSQLRSALITKNNSEARAANLALYQAFYNTLISLIGVSLTDRLLDSIPNNTAGSDTLQDPLQ